LGNSNGKGRAAGAASLRFSIGSLTTTTARFPRRLSAREQRFGHRLLAEAEAGETIIITKHGRPVARLERIAPDAETLSPEDAFAALLSMDTPLGIDIRTLIEDGRRA